MWWPLSLESTCVVCPIECRKPTIGHVLIPYLSCSNVIVTRVFLVFVPTNKSCHIPFRYYRCLHKFSVWSTRVHLCYRHSTFFFPTHACACWLQFYDPSSLVQTLSYVIHESLMYTFWSYLTQDDDRLIDRTRDTLTCASIWNHETHSTRIQSIIVPTYLYFIKCQLLKQSVIYFASKTFLQWSIIVYDEGLDEKSLSIWQYLQHCKSTMPKTCLQGMTNHVRLQVVLVTLHTGGL